MLPLPLSQLLHPSLLELGRLPARATLTPYPDDAARRSGATPWQLSLDGTWAFQLAPGPDQTPEDWTIAPTIGGDWREIEVPGVWTRQGLGDLPHYANWQMPWDCPKPPEVPAANPTGLYRCEFKLPEAWQGRQTVLHLGGFESLAMVWCNGQFIGLGKDSRLPSEFDLSPALQAGANQLAILVMRWCDATWIEDQDHWNHGGLHRSVYLESRAEVHVRDLVVDTDFDPETEAGTAAIRVEMAGPSAGYSVRHVITDAAGKTWAQSDRVAVAQFGTDQPVAAQWAQAYAFRFYAAEIVLKLAQVRHWCAERPQRYRLVTHIFAPDGAMVETHETWIGFTRIEASERRLKVNGAPIVLIGVNRHDHHPETGKTCSAGELRAELITMKRHNINAIRTAHYPNDPVLLDLADELGFYVIDEANVECHARWSEVAHHPGYRAAIVDRTVRMIARDRNHPSIIGWSLGNEAGHGPAHDAAAAAARHLDPGRFVHYEGAISRRLSFPFGRSPETTQQAPSAQERAATDVVCPMYPPIEHIIEWARWAEATELEDRPMLLCEFSHAMGNSNGSLTAYVEAFFAEPALAGGFVWDWRDQGLAETDDQGRFYWAYGGHFGDEPNDANFNINGLVGPDGVPHPALREYMWAGRPLTARLSQDGAIVLTNRRAFADTSDLALHWYLQRDGVSVEQGVLTPQLAAGEAAVLAPPFTIDLDEAAEWHLLLDWRLKVAASWAPAGHRVAWDQLCLRPPAPPRIALPDLSAAEPQGHAATALQHGDLMLEFGDDGGLARVLAEAEPAILSPVTPALWRPPTDNDGGKPGARPLFQNHTAEWVGYGLNALTPGALQAASYWQDGRQVKVFERLWHGAEETALKHQTVISFADDRIVFDEALIVPQAWADVPRVGVRFEVSALFDQLTWYGLGPDESYPDRKAAQTVGVWRSTVAEQYHAYVRPQEYGAHEDTRWLRLQRADGAGIQMTLPKPLSVTVRPHHTADLNAAETLAELRRRGPTEVHIDAAVRGLGTAACGPDTLPQFRVGPGTYHIRWALEAIPGD